MAQIEFTDNYEDLSTRSGYQFKFVVREVRQRLHVQLEGQQDGHGRRTPPGSGHHVWVVFSAVPPPEPTN